ncbi:MAG: hypothetical protein DI603_14050 [Roseateles depolymerans]|uniref:Uncharacterized protein n=1 Tax=Roseateles depolymerans TaxID=76731 RepID=A0A2W5DNA5_9BURK|nr:MAG: hypothetical protein DI603_14050 [Roseateles depolymerans]
MSDWFNHYRQLKSTADEARERLDKEFAFLHERILEWEARPDDYLLIPSDFSGLIAADAEYRRTQAELQRLLVEKYLTLMGG